MHLPEIKVRGPQALQAVLQEPERAIPRAVVRLGNLLRPSRGTPTAGNRGAELCLCACYTKSYAVFRGGVPILVPGKVFMLLSQPDHGKELGPSLPYTPERQWVV